MSTFSLRVSLSHRELLRICLYLTPTMQYEYLSDPCFQDEQYTSFWALLLAKKVKKMTNTSDDTSWNLWVIFCLGHLLATCHLFIWRVATGPKRRAGSYFTTHFTTHFTNCLCYSWTKQNWSTNDFPGRNSTHLTWKDLFRPQASGRRQCLLFINRIAILSNLPVPFSIVSIFLAPILFQWVS